jgi:hypothetical protein
LRDQERDHFHPEAKFFRKADRIQYGLQLSAAGPVITIIKRFEVDLVEIHERAQES